jgi:hypothetical protein
MVVVIIVIERNVPAVRQRMRRKVAVHQRGVMIRSAAYMYVRKGRQEKTQHESQRTGECDKAVHVPSIAGAIAIVNHAPASGSQQR